MLNVSDPVCAMTTRICASQFSPMRAGRSKPGTPARRRESSQLFWFLFLLAVSTAVSLLLLVSGAFYFRRMERTFADVV